MPSPENDSIRNIMKYRLIFVLLRRIIKAADDMHVNTKSDKGRENNANKASFIREQLAAIKNIERQSAR